MTGREEFGPALRRERERRGIGLDQIAERTKISASLFAAMERNDFSRWPGGIFRRSFLRAYAEVVGLEPEALVQRFLHLYPSPDHEVPSPALPKSAPSAPAKPRQDERHHGEPSARVAVLVGPGLATQPYRAERVAAILADLGLVGLLAAIGWLLGGWFGAGPAAALAGILIFVVGNVLLGKTPGSLLMGARSAPALAAARHSATSAKRVMGDDRAHRSAREAHHTARRHTVRRLERSRSRRA